MPPHGSTQPGLHRYEKFNVDTMRSFVRPGGVYWRYYTIAAQLVHVLEVNYDLNKIRLEIVRGGYRTFSYWNNMAWYADGKETWEEVPVEVWLEAILEVS